MKLHDTPISGLKLVEFQVHADARGHFMRTFCARELARHGLQANVAQANSSFNHRRGTIRGMHFQLPPAAESKLVRCTRGAVEDIVVDLRPESPTFLKLFAVELTPDSGLSLYVPERFAHGYRTLEDCTEVSYHVGEFYTPALERGLRFDDPLLKLPWLVDEAIVSDKDRSWPLLDPQRLAALREELAA